MANVKNITELPMAESAEGLNLIVNDGGAAKQIAASAVGAQADWNQNDPTKPDYVKNRPFWTDDIIETIIVSEQIISGFEVMENTIYCVENPFTMPTPPVLGDTYIVNWDGTNYTVLASVSEEGLCYLGNKNYTTMVSGGDIPFAIIVIPDGGPIFVATESTASSHTISVKKLGVVYKLDKKYLPEKEWFFADQEVLDLDKVAKKWFGEDSMFYVGTNDEPMTAAIAKEDWDAFMTVAQKYPVCIARVPFGSYPIDHVAINDVGDDYVYLMMNYLYFDNIKNNMHSLNYVKMNIKLEYNTEISAVTISREYYKSYNTDFILSETIYE